MNITPQQKLVCERIINVFETGSAGGDYANISIYADGPRQIRQITYGRSQTTEYGNLRELVQMYADAGGKYSDAARKYVGVIGRRSLVGDANFQAILRDAGRNDPVMRQTQDAFFDKRYWQPAMQWADENGFTLPLSALVIYDSFIHSGGILGFLRARFEAKTPSAGGDEKAWISQYVDTRQEWLANHSMSILRGTVYRTQCFKHEIARGNWDLTQLPIIAHGVAVDADEPPAPAAPQPSEQIKWVQASLNALGFDLVVDGFDGPATQTAVMTFQQQHDLRVDGIAGPETIAALEQKTAKQEATDMSAWISNILLSMLGSAQIQSIVRKLLTIVGTSLLLKLGFDSGTAGSLIDSVITALGGVVALGASFYGSAQAHSPNIANPVRLELSAAE